MIVNVPEPRIGTSLGVRDVCEFDNLPVEAEGNDSLGLTIKFVNWNLGFCREGKEVGRHIEAVIKAPFRLLEEPADPILRFCVIFAHLFCFKPLVSLSPVGGIHLGAVGVAILQPSIDEVGNAPETFVNVGGHLS